MIEIYRDVAFVIGNNAAQPILHRYRIFLRQVDEGANKWEITRTVDLDGEAQA